MLRSKSKLPTLAAILGMGLPTLATFLYLTLGAQATYETEFKLVVQESQSSQRNGLGTLPAMLLGGSHSASRENALFLEDYFHSFTLLSEADGALNLRQHFSEESGDVFRRLRQNAENERFLAFMRKKIGTSTRVDSGVLTVRVRSFSPDMSLGLAQFLIEQGESKINALNRRLIEAQTDSAARELEIVENRMSKIRREILDFQTRYGMLDPSEETAARLTVLAELDSKIVEARTELRRLESFLRPDSLEMRQARQRLNALIEQRAEEQRRIIEDDDSEVARTLQKYENLQVSLEFALTAYTSALTVYEQARMEASRQEKFLSVLAPPHHPERPVFPRPLRGSLTALVLSMALFSIARLFLATIRDHSV